MRRIALGMGQTKLAENVGVTFQQVQKYEKGTNRIGASRLSQIAGVLQIPAASFFESVLHNKPLGTLSSAQEILDFLGSPDDKILVRGFTQIEDAKLRRHIVALVERIAELHCN
jgi:transcriptional regulator with XRE-family HTH domain